MPIFMQFEGIEGDSMAEAYRNWHEALSFSWGVANVTAGGGGGGGSAGRSDFSDLNVLRQCGKGSPVFMHACASGKILPAVQMDIVQSGGESFQVIQRYTLRRVMISSYQVSGSGGEVPVESLSLNFERIKFEQAVFNADGSVRFQNATWDQRTNSGSVNP